MGSVASMLGRIKKLQGLEGKMAEAARTCHSMPMSDHELKNRIAFLYKQGGRGAITEMIRDCGFSEQRVEQALRFFP